MMKDQGAGGGIESHMPTHRRQDSKEEPIPAEATAETQSPTPEPDQKEKLSQQELPRGSQILVGDETGAVPPAVEVAPSLSRNPSSCSTSSNVQPVSEYLAAQSTDRRPSAVQAAQSLSRNTSGSNVRPVSEYLAAQPTERRPLPLSRSTASSFPASSRPLEPPVTRTTLSELDVHKIIHNPKLRHDINFDPELHFRPNLDGERGRRKQEKANQFWAALLEQLVQFVVDRDGFIKAHGANGDWTLPSLLRAIKEIISTLVPQRDRQVLEEGLNLDLLMQQFNRGVADLEKLASWLSGILKLHCAPMRDEWVDEMYAELSNGNRNNDMNELVKGMRSLLSVLEAMKLDVANHQIRCLRPVLIDDTVNFEQRFFLKKIQAKKLDVKKATAWYQEAQAQAHMLLGNSTPMLYAQSFGDTAVFFNALSRLILPSTSTENFPATFVFDEDRIIKLRADMYDSICLEICMRKFDDLDQVSRVAPMNTFLSAFSSGSARSSRSSGDFNFAAPRSRPSSMAFSDRGSVASSPRNSGGLFGHSIPDAGELRARSQTVYNSLLALLNTASPSSRSQQKWKSLAQPMALQILRYINNAPPLPEFEALLTKCLTEVQSDIFREVEAQFQQRLLAELAKRVKEFRSLSGVGLFSVATGGRIHGAGRTWDRSGDRDHRDSMIIDSGNGSSSREPRDEAGIDDMAVRLAHLGILHWRVWSQLAYEVDTEITGTD